MTAGSRSHAKQRLVIRVLSAALDLSILLVLAASLTIIATGGGLVTVRGVALRARSVENPLWVLTGLVLLRYMTRSWPVFGVRRWSVGSILNSGARLVLERCPDKAARMFSGRMTGIVSLAAIVFTIKVLVAAISPGFYSGDDVEVHEMTLGVLLGKPWPVWDIRCAFFPMTFVYPAQRVAMALGASSTEMLVLAGRVAVALVSTVAIPLTWLAARRLSPGDPRLAAVSVLLLAINKLQMSFGSSELPRPVATVFVLAAFTCVIRGRLRATVLAGALLGTAIAFRFSEIAFIPAALTTLRHERVWAHRLGLLATAGLTAAAVIGVSDALYWGHPFSSLIAAFEYTVTQRQSSRGFEPAWEYLKILPGWSTFTIVALAVVGSSRRAPDSWWLWLPITILSMLPHKESRYLLPVIPFLCIAAARGFLRVSEWIGATGDVSGWRRWAKDLAAPLLVVSVLHDVGGWRLSRSNEGIRLTQYVQRANGGTGIAGQDLWRLGGRPYLWSLEPVVDITPDILDDRIRLFAAVKDVSWVALRYRVARISGDSAMQSMGFVRDLEWRGADYVLYVRSKPVPE